MAVTQGFSSAVLRQGCVRQMQLPLHALGHEKGGGVYRAISGNIAVRKAVAVSQQPASRRTGVKAGKDGDANDLFVGHRLLLRYRLPCSRRSV